MDKCPICREKAQMEHEVHFSELVGLAKKYTQRICICSFCQLIFVSNPLSESSLLEYYRSLSAYEGITSEGSVGPEKIKMSKRQFSFITEKISGFSSILEIGASTGFNLSTFKKKLGVPVVGVDPSPRNKSFAKQKYGIDLYTGSFKDFLRDNSSMKYELVILSHVLEHLHNPVEVLEGIRSINTRWIYVEVPSFESQSTEEPFGVFFHEHIFHFSVESLSRLMASKGYRGLRISIEYNLDGESPMHPVVCSLWEKSENTFFRSSSIDAKTLLRAYLKTSRENFAYIREKIESIDDFLPLAVWGTGSHTSKLLSSTGLGNKNIVKFYDSDPKKTGIKIMGKSITPFDISDIANGLVRGILISTCSGEPHILSFLEKLKIDAEIFPLYAI